MEAPTSAILAEIFIQYLEHTSIINIHKKKTASLINTDMLTICWSCTTKITTNIENTLADFKSIHPNIQFTIETETHNKLNYLHLTITNLHNTLALIIYGKPTFTDLIIHNDSCHPQEHKNAAINYLINHMNTYPITDTKKNQELQHKNNTTWQ
jgi:hypothetical protein